MTSEVRFPAPTIPAREYSGGRTWKGIPETVLDVVAEGNEYGFRGEYGLRTGGLLACVF